MQGSLGDFSAFYARTKEPVFRAALLAIGDHHQAEDAVSEAYVRALRHWWRLRHHPNPTAWVMRVTLNVHKTAWRRWRAVPGRAADHDPEPAFVEPGLDPTLVRLVNRLPPGQREALALRILLDLSTRQTARVLGVAEGTVKAQLHHALSQLRDRLSAPEQEDVWR